MSNLTDEVNASQARSTLIDWLSSHQAITGETLNDIGQHLRNPDDQPLGHPALSPWFSRDSKQARLMPPYRAIQLSKAYDSFPLQKYLQEFFEFHESNNKGDDRLLGAYAFIEAYGEILGKGYIYKEYEMLFEMIFEMEELFGFKFPTVLHDDHKATFKKAIESIMFEESQC